MDHPASTNFNPLFAPFHRFRFYVDLETGLREWKVMRPKTHCGICSEKLAQEKFKRTLQISDANLFIHVKPFDLVKLCAVGGVDFVTPIGRPRGDDANWWGRSLHGADLHRGGMGAEKTAVPQVESILLIPRWMIWRRVERVEAMPFRLDIRAVG